MAINFEAANMAGYNNQKIEVFEVVLGETGIVKFPKKSVILDCINSGSVPFILITYGSSYDPVYLLPLSFIDTEMNAIYFCGTENSDATLLRVVSICYNSDESAPPEFRLTSTPTTVT